MAALMLCVMLLATPAGVAAPPPDALTPEQIAESRRRYMRMLVLPGAALGGLTIAAVVVYANHARRRRLGE